MVRRLWRVELFEFFMKSELSINGHSVVNQNF